MIEKIKRKLKILRIREQQAIKDMNFAECLKLEGAIFHIEDLYQYAMSASQPIDAVDVECQCRFNDAWRCAKDQGITDQIACKCSCHSRY